MNAPTTRLATYVLATALAACSSSSRRARCPAATISPRPLRPSTPPGGASTFRTRACSRTASSSASSRRWTAPRFRSGIAGVASIRRGRCTRWAPSPPPPAPPPPPPPGAPTCTSFTYSAWGACQASGSQTRTELSASPSGCKGGAPVLSQPCTYVDGEALFAQHCAGCHGNAKKGRSVAAIDGAISGNIGGMGSLKSLSAAQISAISAAP